MKRRILALVIAMIPAIGHAQIQPVRAWIPGYMQTLSIDSLSAPFDMMASRGATFAAASAVFDELKIPMQVRDSAAGVIGNPSYIKMRNLAGMGMSRLLSCGSGMTGPNADSWRIYITVFAFVEGKGDDKSVLHVGFIGGAKDIDGASKDAVACATSGLFESTFADRVKKRLFR